MIAVCIYSVLILLIFILSDLLYHRLSVSSDHSRKFVHLCSGMLCLSFPLYINTIWQITLMAILFFGLLFISERKTWFKGITAVERKTKGSWLFVVSVWISFVIYLETNDTTYFILPIAILAFADTAAFFVGSNFPIKEFAFLSGKKSLGGSLAFFVMAIMVFVAFNLLIPTNYLSFTILSVLLCSTAITLSEAFSSKGWDNLMIPIVTLCCIYFYRLFHLIA